MSKKIIVCVGVSNSGKSTYTSKLVQSEPTKYISVNRDKIRELLFGYTEQNVNEYYTREDFSKMEKQITLYEDTLINEGLCQNKTVIVDATHLSKDYILRHTFWNVPLEIKWFDITLKEALTRNIGRNRKVDENVITKQYSRFIQLRKSFTVENIEPVTFYNDRLKPSVWVFDIDGTIAHMNGRSAYDWSKVGDDDLDKNVSNLFNILNRDDYMGCNENIIFCSGRDEVCKNDTLEWLRFHLGKFNDYKLMMRPKGDQRPDWIVKEELWRDIAKNYYIEALIDDRNQVVRRARSLGLKVFQVEYGNF